MRQLFCVCEYILDHIVCAFQIVHMFEIWNSNRNSSSSTVSERTLNFTWVSTYHFHDQCNPSVLRRFETRQALVCHRRVNDHNIIYMCIIYQRYFLDITQGQQTGKNFGNISWNCEVSWMRQPCEVSRSHTTML